MEEVENPGREKFRRFGLLGIEGRVKPDIYFLSASVVEPPEDALLLCPLRLSRRVFLVSSSR
jgi:hypothetical protein